MSERDITLVRHGIDDCGGCPGHTEGTCDMTTDPDLMDECSRALDRITEYVALMEALYEAVRSFAWDEEGEAYDTALYRYEKAVAAAHDAITAWREAHR